MVGVGTVWARFWAGLSLVVYYLGLAGSAFPFLSLTSVAAPLVAGGLLLAILTAPVEYALGAVAAAFLAATCAQLANTFQNLRWAVLIVGIVVLSLRFFLTRPATRPGIASKFMYLLSCFIAISTVTLAISVSFDFSALKFVALLCLFFLAWRGAADLVAAYGPFGASRLMTGMVVHPAGLLALSAVSYFGVGVGAPSTRGFGGYLGNSNALGGLILIVLPWIACALFRSSPVSRSSRLGFALGLIVAGYMLLLTAARASILGALLAASFLFAVHASRRVAALLILFSTLAAARIVADPALIPSLAERYFYKQRLNDVPGKNPLQSRVGPWKLSGQTFSENPWFGLGFGVTSRAEASWGFSTRSGSAALETGSSFWSSLIQVGILGSVPLFLAVLVLLFDAGRFAWKVKDPLFTGVYASTLALSVSAAFEGWLIAPGSFPTTYFWVQCFFLSAVVSRYQPASVRTAPAAFGPARSPAFADTRR